MKNWSLFKKEIFPAFILSRSIVALFVYMGHAHHTYLEHPPTDLWTGIPVWLINPWTTWDSRWLIEIAKNGYHISMTHAFFPLYSFLMSLCQSQNDATLALAGIILSNLFLFFSFFFLFKLVALDYDESLAQKTLWLFCLFPTTVFFSAVYTESLFFFLSVSSFYFAKKGRWWLAGLLGGLAALTRNTGFVLSAAFLIEYLLQTKKKALPRRLKDLIPLSLPLAGLAGFAGFLAILSGNPMEALYAQKLFHRSITWPWLPLIKEIYYLTGMLAFPPREWNNIFIYSFNFITFILILHTAIRRVKETPPSYSLFMFPIILMHLTFARDLVPYTGGALRYMAVTFPYTILIAQVYSGLPASSVRAFQIIYLAACGFHCFLFGQRYFLG